VCPPPQAEGGADGMTDEVREEGPRGALAVCPHEELC
jgi:hypothetical protein